MAYTALMPYSGQPAFRRHWPYSRFFCKLAAIIPPRPCPHQVADCRIGRNGHRTEDQHEGGRRHCHPLKTVPSCELHPCPKIFPGILWLDAVILMTRNQKTKGDLFAKFFKTCLFMKEIQEIKVSFKKNCPLLTRVFSLSKEGRQWLRPLLQYKSGLLSVRCRKDFPIPE